MKKKIVIATLFMCMSLSTAGCGDSKIVLPEIEAAKEPTEAPVFETPAAEESINTIEENKRDENEGDENDEPLGFPVQFSATYRDDQYDTWRLAEISEDINFEEYALDYYHHYFQSDKEIHFVINFARNTTTRITSLGGSILDLTIKEYVDGEEDDANLACSGALLSRYQIDVKTGDMVQIE